MKICLRGALSFVCLVLLSGTASAQDVRVEVRDARLSIPFGEVRGTLVRVGEYLVFIDEDQPNNSFGVNRGDVRNISAQEDRVTVDLNHPVRDRSGERTTFIFQLPDPADAMALTNWPQMGNTSAGMATSPASAQTAGSGTQTAIGTQGSNGVIATYQVTHGHMFGGCHGRLIIRQDIIAYESIDKIEDSRQWALRDVRELKLDNPYELGVKPFRGDDYKITFDGKGMDTGVFRQLVERVTSSRTAE